MAARLKQDAKRRAGKKPAQVVEKTGLLRNTRGGRISHAELQWDRAELQDVSEARGTALWDKSIESLGRSADVLEELAESTGEVIARIAARGDRIDRIQKETRDLLNALTAAEAGA